MHSARGLASTGTRAVVKGLSECASGETEQAAMITPNSSCSGAVDDTNPDPILGRIRKPRNELMPIRSELEPWDSAANVTLLGCKIGALNRLPASFYVSVAYDCWAYRRSGCATRCQTQARSNAGYSGTKTRRNLPTNRDCRLPDANSTSPRR